MGVARPLADLAHLWPAEVGIVKTVSVLSGSTKELLWWLGMPGLWFANCEYFTGPSTHNLNVPARTEGQNFVDIQNPRNFPPTACSSVVPQHLS